MGYKTPPARIPLDPMRLHSSVGFELLDQESFFNIKTLNWWAMNQIDGPESLLQSLAHLDIWIPSFLFIGGALHAPYNEVHTTA